MYKKKSHQNLPVIEHVGFLEPHVTVPESLLTPHHIYGVEHKGHYSCAYCGVGNGANLKTQEVSESKSQQPTQTEETGIFRVESLGQVVEYRAFMNEHGFVDLITESPVVASGQVLTGVFYSVPEDVFYELKGALNEDLDANSSRQMMIREAGLLQAEAGNTIAQRFSFYTTTTRSTENLVHSKAPTQGCVKFKTSMGEQRTVFPIHIAPSVLDVTGYRVPLFYPEALTRLADLLLAHRAPYGRTLVYACGQVDYFTVFALQEVFRLLGVRNLTGNTEHGQQSGSVAHEILTGQEGPFLTLDQALHGSNHFFLLSGWNGFISHPPVFHELLKHKQLDAYLIDVMVTESAKMLAAKLRPDRILMIRSGTDSHLALAVAHELLQQYPQAVEQRFIDQFSDIETFKSFVSLAMQPQFAPAAVANRIAPDVTYVERLLKGIQHIASKLAQADTVPIHIPSVGLSHTKGVVPHCLWGNVLAMLGKYGIKPDGSPAGGVLRMAGQINDQSLIQGLSPERMMGRIPLTPAGIKEAAKRMALPENAYEGLLTEPFRPALDYAKPTAENELIICLGTQFSSNMINRPRWLKKLRSPNTTLVVIDPIPDPFALSHAALVIPSPPHAAASKLYQNGEWRLTLSLPRKQASPETRTDATILYDVMAEISQRLNEDLALRLQHPDLAALVESGYLRERFEAPEQGGGLLRQNGEVSRPQIWERITHYLQGLYCLPTHPDGRVITWDDLLEAGQICYGGVGQQRFVLNYDRPEKVPFADIYGTPRPFTFFIPTEADLSIPDAILLNTGRSSMSDEPKRIRFALSTFNSGKATTGVDMPAENELHLSLSLAEKLGIQAGEQVRVSNCETGAALILPALPSNRLKGNTVYVSFHKCQAELHDERFINTLTSHTGRCPYTGQTNLKITPVRLERLMPEEA